jgi:muramoyltetrapeptide carboxypeptidase
MTGSLRKAPALTRGSRLSLVAPASGFDRREFDAGVAELRALGFDPAWDDRVFARRSYVAGDADLRAAAFTDAWQAPEVAGIVGVRGGYGSVQLLPRLDPERLASRTPAVVGYSDLTSLLTFLVCRCGVVCFHGPTVAGRLGLGPRGYDRESFLRAVTRTEPAGELGGAGLESIRSGEAAGRLLGGTLTQLAAAAGTAYALAPWDDTILLLEDVAERPYRLDRMLEQLRLSGALSRVRGIVLGTFPRCDEPGGALTARSALADLLAGFPGPVVFGFPTGHVEGPALTVPLGVHVRLVAGPNSVLAVEEAAVE